MISAMVLTAISAGVSAPMSRPIGVMILRSKSSGIPFRLNLERMPLAFDWLEIIPMYAALDLTTVLNANSSDSPAYVKITM